MFEKLIPYDAAYTILDAYIQYYHVFKRITKRAKIRFEQRDWVGNREPRTPSDFGGAVGPY